MERVAFLIEPGGRRIGCLLNPEGITLRRQAGVTRRRSEGGALAGKGLSDDPLLFTGGGRTELELDLLFDVSLSGSSVAASDVRELTRPLWDLTENAAEDGAYGRPPIVRFVWGKGWNIPGVVTAVAERLERFTAEGTPRRSWLRLRLTRVPEPPPAPPALPPGRLGAELPDVLEFPALAELEHLPVHEVLGGRPAEAAAPGAGAEAEEQGQGERLDELAYRYLGDPASWRWLAYFNGLADPLRLAPGSILRLPSFLRPSAP